MVKNILMLSVFLFSVFFFMKSEEKGVPSDYTGIQAIDVSCCIDVVIDNEFANRPFGQLRFTEKNLTDSIFKGIYREKCESGVGQEEVSFFYTFYICRGSTKYTFMKLYQKDEYVPGYVEITCSDYTLLHISKGGQKIKTGDTKEKVTEILGIKSSNMCDTLRITDEEGTSDITLYFEANRLKKIVLQNNL